MRPNSRRRPHPPYSSLHHWKIIALTSLHVRGGGGTRDNLDELAGNDGLASAVEENLVFLDHVSGVLGGVLRELELEMQKRRQRRKEHSHPWHCGGQRSRKRGPRKGPSRWSWQGCTRGGWEARPPQSRRWQSWLNHTISWCPTNGTRNTGGTHGTK